jgi:hypothetical protein
MQYSTTDLNQNTVVLFSSRAIIPSLLGERQEAHLVGDIFPNDTIGEISLTKAQ